MRDISAARRYAKALFELAVEKDCLDETVDGLDLLKEAFRHIPEFRAFIFSFRLETDRKIEGLSAVFGEAFTPLLGNFFTTLINKRRQELLPDIGDAFHGLALDKMNRVSVTAVTHVPLDEEGRERIKNIVGGVMNKEVALDPRVDSSILGGLVLRIGNRVIDGSVKGTLKRMKASLLD